jgi:glycosyltransferase involved in cell wall biosynthesis
MLESRACARADCVVVPSRFSARALTRAGATRPEQVVVIPRGVTPPPDPAPSERQPATGATARGGARSAVLLSIGRLVGRKDPLLLVEAMARVERALPGRARLRLIGDGPLAGDILERSRSLGIAASVEVCGRREEQEKWRELRSCTLFVTASRCEGFGIAAAEAMMAGAPVVAPRDSAFPEIIENGRHGLLVEPRSADAFAEAIIALLREPRRARALGTAAGERASAEFSWDAAARRLQGLYRDLQHQLAGRT